MMLFSMFHLLLMLYMIGYVFIFNQSKNIYGDILYYTICFVTILTWFMNNGSCILTTSIERPIPCFAESSSVLCRRKSPLRSDFSGNVEYGIRSRAKDMENPTEKMDVVSTHILKNDVGVLRNMDIYDVHQLLPFLSDFQMKIFLNIVILGTIINLIIIHLRSHLLPPYVLIGFIVIYSVYLLYLRHFYNEDMYNILRLNKTNEILLTSVSFVYIIYCLFLLRKKYF